jgi:hypothetical protein
MAFNQECAAPGCTNPSTRRGEHVLPNWLMRAFTTRVWSPGPYRAEHSSRGIEHTSNQVAYTKVPCCEEHNETLGKHFEHHGQEAAKHLFGIESLKNTKGDTVDYAVHPLDEQAPLDQASTDLFARWLVKTMCSTTTSRPCGR